MPEPLTPIQQALLFSPCVLLVHPEVRRLQDEVARLHEEAGWPVLRAGRSLSEALLEEPPTRRPWAARSYMEAVLGEAAPGPLLCRDVDLLFEPSLALDPLALFRNASRVTKLVVAWPGSYSDGVLSYAVPEHGHHRIWRDTQVKVHLLP